MSLPVCKFYNTSQSCRFGKNCRFLHPRSQRPPPSSFNPRNQNEDSVSKELASQDLPPVYSRNDQFASQSQDEESVNQTSVKLQASHIEDKPKQELPQSRVRPKSNQKICVHFAQGGNCYYGRNCRFSHALPRGHNPRQQQHRQQGQRRREYASANLAPRFRGNEQESQDQSDAPTDKSENLKSGSVRSEVSKDGRDRWSSKPAEPKQVREVQGPKSNARRICPFYKSNRCNRGERCRFLHPPDILNDLGKEESEQKEEGSSGNISRKDNETRKVIVQIDQKRNVGRPVLKPVLSYSEFEEVGITRLRQWEVSIIQKRFPKDKITVVEDDENKFAVRIKFSPTDPDWPFDVNMFELLVSVPGSYPKQMLEVSLPKDQDLPETVRRYIDITIREWLMDKKKRLESANKVELVFRPFLKWLDRSIEDITTEALKQLKRELVAKAAGMEFISPQQLQERFRTKSGSSGEGGERSDPEEESLEDSDEETDDSDDDDDSSEDEEDEGNGENPSLSLEPEKKGTEIEFRHLQLKGNASALLADRLKVVIQCGRCKNHADLTVHQGKVVSLSCGKCSQRQFVNYRAALMHQFSSTVGYLDVDGCQPFDLVLQECRVFVSCLGCSKQTKIEGLISGQMIDGWCQACNAKFKLATESVKFTQLVPSGVDTSVSNVVEVAPSRTRKPPKDPAIREGLPLPEFGTCKHYKHSYRWLRFPCCGKAYPCDVCHDKKEDHEMTLANRMICGHCCKEQNFSASRPCSACGQHMTKIRSAHWEGGRGCRDKISMSRNDQQKYRSLHKTQSNHRKKVQSGASSKKNTKLRHS